MGIICEKLNVVARFIPNSAALCKRIDRDISSRPTIDQGLLREAKVSTYSIAGRARLNGLDVISVVMPDSMVFSYCYKSSSSSNESAISRTASDLQIGPRVLDTYGTGKGGYILEECFGMDDAFNRRGVGDFHDLGRSLAGTFLRFVHPTEGLVLNNDLKTEHAYIVGASDPQVKFIDWGKAHVMPYSSLTDWTTEILYPFYNIFYLNNPVQWKNFVDNVCQGLRSNPALNPLDTSSDFAVAFSRFVISNVDIGGGARKGLVTRFIQTNIDAFPFNFDIGPLSKFFESIKLKWQPNLLFEFQRWVNDNKAQLMAWESRVLSPKSKQFYI